MLHRPDCLSSLMRAANRGDQRAYRRVLEALSVWLRQAVRRSLARANRGPEDTEDIVQEALLAIHVKRHTWDETMPLEPWARAIAHHKLVDHLRRQGFRETVHIDDYAGVLADPRPSATASRIDVQALMSSLTTRQGEIVHGMSLEGRSAREVGLRFGMSESAVRVTLHRALKLMAQASRRGDT
ncbi:MAG: sigma-70 family RNA polymerase sigma factor [Hyphomicrobiaceae bacterium]|nr:sigma-70 family RNA polymerase sigma factor [Hyphomicrobiaceae bacterium]